MLEWLPQFLSWISSFGLLHRLGLLILRKIDSYCQNRNVDFLRLLVRSNKENESVWNTAFVEQYIYHYRQLKIWDKVIKNGAYAKKSIKSDIARLQLTVTVSSYNELADILKANMTGLYNMNIGDWQDSFDTILWSSMHRKIIAENEVFIIPRCLLLNPDGSEGAVVNREDSIRICKNKNWKD